MKSDRGRDKKERTEAEEVEEVLIYDDWPPEEIDQEEDEEALEDDEDHFSWEDVYSMNGCSTFFG